MANVLEVGQTRLGQLIDGDPDTPEVTVSLERNESGIYLSVPWTEQHTSPYARWFSSGTHWGDDPDRILYSYEVPRNLLFEDSQGHVSLIGCRAIGMRSNFFAGVGRVRVRTAVLGAADDVSFERVHGLRTEVPGLNAWLGLHGIEREDEITDEGWLSTSLKVARTDSLSLIEKRGFVVTVDPSWRVTDEDDASTLRAVSYLTSLTESESDWSDHLKWHRGLRDLLAVSLWQDLTLVPGSVTHDSDPLTTLDGQAHGRQWRGVVTASQLGGSVRNRREHLIQFSEVNLAGVERWFDLQEQFARAIDPIVSSLPLDAADFEVRLAQVATGLEALGYLLLQRDSGLTAAAANKAPLAVRLQLIANLVRPVASFNVDAWALSLASAYNGLKHANRTLPDHLDVANRWRESVLVFRLWVALEVGTEPTALRSRADRDRMVTPYEQG